MALWDITLHGSADCVWDKDGYYERNHDAAELDNDHFMIMWDSSYGDDDLLLRVYEIDGSGIPSAAGDLYKLVEGTQTLDSYSYILKWQDDCCIAFYIDSDYDCQIQVITYNSDTWNITGAGSVLNIGSGIAYSHYALGLFKLEDAGNHVLFIWRGDSSDLCLQAGSVDIAGSSVSLVGSAALIARTVDATAISAGVADLDSAGHYAFVWNSSNNQYLRTFEIDGSGQLSWAGNELDGGGGMKGAAHIGRSLYKIGPSHLSVLRGTSGGSVFRVYSFSNSDWSYTYVDALTNPFGDAGFCMEVCARRLDGVSNKFIMLGRDQGSPYKTRMRCVGVDMGDYSISALGSAHYEANIAFRGLVPLVRDADDFYEYVLLYTSDKVSPYDNYLRTFKIQTQYTSRKYLNLFAHAAGTQYKYLESEAKAGLIALHDALVETGPAAYGSFSYLLMEAKGAGVLWEFLNTEISNVSNCYTAFSKVFFEAKGANALFKFFRGDARAAVAVFKTLSCVAGARYIIDTDIPYIRYDHYPVDGQVAVSPYHPIIMRIVDDGLGLDLSSYWCKVNGVKYSYGDAEVKAYPVNPPNEYLFAVKPAFMEWNKSVTVDVYCSDLYGNPGLLREVL